VRSYEAFREYLRDGRTDVEPGRPLRNNTRVYYHGEAPGQEIYIRYHATEILCFHPDGVIDFNFSGWHTRTTFDRLDEYSPFAFWQWRISRKVDPVTVINLDGGRRWMDRTQPGRRFIVPEDSGVIRVHPDRRRVPYELSGYKDGEPRRLQTVESWERQWRADREREKRAQMRFTREKARHTLRLRQLQQFITRHRLNDAMVREICPSLATIELRSRSLVTAAEDRALALQERWRQEREQLKEQISKLTADLAYSERERDEYMYSLDAINSKNRPPDERERIVSLENP